MLSFHPILRPIGSNVDKHAHQVSTLFPRSIRTQMIVAMAAEASPTTPKAAGQPVTQLGGSLQGQCVAILGGSAGMGKATAASVLVRGGSVLLLSRTESKLEAAKAELLTALPGASTDRVRIHAIDGNDETAMNEYFDSLEKGSLHHLVATAGGSTGGGAFLSHSFKNVMDQLNAKLGAQWIAARYAAPVLAPGGSITLFSGGLSVRPGTNSSLLAMANAALEALTKSLANELGPALRVNCLSPGLTRTDAFAKMPADAQDAMFAAVADKLLVKRAGDAADMGEATAGLVSNGFITGAVLRVDGGHTVM